ncbi:hypothetical protein E2562_012251 [Oryza meyeriana var. granulata]|uniref:Uncharacterized protein n=1 Tax=Oryza meyeriana var. granulata TaxID=110450 RepID=A0A6G1D2V9_9ORYZ|nr:hypothetical protein E2562_012251 [Oryza meyeriana var. granulata]
MDEVVTARKESWNKWIKELKDLPMVELADAISSKIMDLLARRRMIGRIRPNKGGGANGAASTSTAEYLILKY